LSYNAISRFSRRLGCEPLAPLAYLLLSGHEAFHDWTRFAGLEGDHNGFDLLSLPMTPVALPSQIRSVTAVENWYGADGRMPCWSEALPTIGIWQPWSAT
jgi:hypothetical protein